MAIRNGPVPGLTADQVAELRARVGTGRPQSVTAAAAAMGISRATAHRYLAMADDWKPACMDADEYALWQRGDDQVGRTNGAQRGRRPCADCTLGHAADMRAQGRCNGTPAGVVDDEEEDPAIESAEAPSLVTRRIEIDGALPCDGCSHAVVCGLKANLEGLRAIEVRIPRLPAVQGVTLAASLTCEYREGPKAKRQLSEAGRAAIATAAKNRKPRGQAEA